MEAVQSLKFSWYDYPIFVLVLVFSLLIGIYFGYFSKNKQSNVHEYVYGGKNLTPLQIAISQVAGYNSTSIILGHCLEVYSYGATIWIYSFSYVLLYFLNMYIFLPIFFNLRVATIYEYLEMRFDRKTRVFTSAMFTSSSIVYLTILIYTPALALSAATGITIQYLVLSVSAICILYTTIGGLKTVVWTDTLQFFVVLVTLVIILILGIVSVNGFAEIWTKSRNGGRLTLDFDLNPTKHDTFWIIIFGASMNAYSITVDQMSVQKNLSLPTFKKSTVLYLAIGQFLFLTLLTVLALTMYAKYSNCDPLSAGIVEKPDQLLPYFAMDVGRMVPGFSGIFLAAIFCSSLSLQSAILNTIPATIYADFIKKHLENVSEKKATAILKYLTVAVGILSTALVFVVEYTGSLFSFIFTVWGITFGPMMGLFTCGILLPKVNSKGAFYGTLIGICICLFIAVPSMYYKSQNLIVDLPRPFSTSECSIRNQTIFSLNSTNPETSFTPHFIFRISYYYYTPIGVFFTIISALVIGYVTNKNDSPVDRKLLCRSIWPLQENVSRDNTEYRSVDEALRCLDNH